MLSNATCTAYAEVKAAYRARMKVYHPDVYIGDGDGEAMSRRIVAAYRAVVEESDGGGVASSVVIEWDGVSVGLALFTPHRYFADTRHMQVMTAGKVHVTNLTPGSANPTPRKCSRGREKTRILSNSPRAPPTPSLSTSSTAGEKARARLTAAAWSAARGGAVQVECRRPIACKRLVSTLEPLK